MRAVGLFAAAALLLQAQAALGTGNGLGCDSPAPAANRCEDGPEWAVGWPEFSFGLAGFVGEVKSELRQDEDNRRLSVTCWSLAAPTQEGLLWDCGPAHGSFRLWEQTTLVCKASASDEVVGEDYGPAGVFGCRVTWRT